MKFTGKFKGFSKDYMTGEGLITFSVNENIINQIDNIKDIDLSVDAKKKTEKRSLNANAYFHVLVGKIAEKIGTSKIYMKNRLIARYGQPEFLGDDLMVMKSMVSTEVMYEREDFHMVAIARKMEGEKEVIFYKVMRGSHTYDTREMSELIKGTANEAQELGIEILTPQELERMIGLWRPKKAYYKI